MLKRPISIVLILILNIPTFLFAQEPLITNLDKGQKAPWQGTLFNPTAVAKTIAETEGKLEECKQDFNFKLKKNKAQCDFLLENERILRESLQKRHDEIIKIKDREIDRLHLIIENADNSDSYLWWFAGGATTGITLSVVIFYAAVRIVQ